MPDRKQYLKTSIVQFLHLPVILELALGAQKISPGKIPVRKWVSPKSCIASTAVRTSQLSRHLRWLGSETIDKGQSDHGAPAGWA